ncbi:MAG: lactonase family protein, partial [Planctomycetota bacterium]
MFARIDTGQVWPLSALPSRLAFCFLIASSCTTCSAEMIDVFFGTTTPRNGLSQGIYHAGFDTERGKFSQPTLAAKMSGCGFLALHPNGNVLYSTGSPDGGAEITAFRVSGKPGELTLTMIGSQPTSDGGAAHLTVDRTGKLLLSAQYGGGSTSIYPLAEDGAIAAPGKPHEHSELATPAGSGVVPRRQDAPHAHWCGTSPDNRFAFVPDLGMDKVVIWKIDAKSPSLKHHGFGVCPPGGGPRHMKFSPDGKTIYVLNELSLSVTRFAYDAASGSMTALQTLPVLSEAVKAKETFNSASEIRVHPSGRFVYSANRGNDSIT